MTDNDIAQYKNKKLSVKEIIVNTTAFLGTLSLIIATLHEFGYFYFVGMKYFALLSPADFIKSIAYWLPFNIGIIILVPASQIISGMIYMFLRPPFDRSPSGRESRRMRRKFCVIIKSGSRKLARREQLSIQEQYENDRLSGPVSHGDEPSKLFTQLVDIAFIHSSVDIFWITVILLMFSIPFATIGAMIYIASYALIVATILLFIRFIQRELPMRQKETQLAAVIISSMIICPIFFLLGISSAYRDTTANQTVGYLEASSIKDNNNDVVVVRLLEKGVLYKQAKNIGFIPWDDVKLVRMPAPDDTNRSVGRIALDIFLELSAPLLTYTKNLFEIVRSKIDQAVPKIFNLWK